MDLIQVFNDVALLMKFFSSSFGYEISADSGCAASWKKTKALEIIQQFFDQPDTEVCVLIYCGHGEAGTGNWMMDDNKTISFPDILRLWKLSRSNVQQSQPPLFRHLLLYLDSCYSGHWCDLATRMNVPDVSIQASASAEQRAGDGVFTKLWIEFETDPGSRTRVLRSLESYGQLPKAHRPQSCFLPLLF